jgi:diaminopimelate decarboxylase
MLRVAPGVDTHTHEAIRTGQIDSKFGFSPEEAFNLIPQIMKCHFLKLKGLHCHIGSQLFDIKFYELAIQEMITLMSRIYFKYHLNLESLDLGGGLGVQYRSDDQPPSIRLLVDRLVNKVRSEVENRKIDMPELMVEPGRSIVGEAGITLYSVGNIKTIPGIRKYIMVDGGMGDNPRPSLYNAQYDAILVNKLNEKEKETVTIAGKCCESGDILIRHISLPHAISGDLLLVFTTGAYHYSMASNYNQIPKPPVVLVNQGKDELIVKREDYQDLTRNERIPSWLI